MELEEAMIFESESEQLKLYVPEPSLACGWIPVIGWMNEQMEAKWWEKSA